MWSWLDSLSIETLTTYHSWTHYALAVFATLTALFMFLNFFLTKRISSLRDSDVLNLQKRLEKAENVTGYTHDKLQQLQEKQQPRNITPEQSKGFLEYSRNFPKGSIDIISVLGDSESSNFALTLKNMLGKAGWNINSFGQSVFPGGDPHLVSLRVHSQETIPPHAAALKKSLSYIGIKSWWVVEQSKPPQSVTLVIGHKQLPN